MLSVSFKYHSTNFFRGGHSRILVKKKSGWDYAKIKDFLDLERIGVAEYEHERIFGRWNHYLKLELEIADDDGDDEYKLTKKKLANEIAPLAELMLREGYSDDALDFIAVGGITQPLGVETQVETEGAPEGGPYYGPPDGFAAWFCNRECSRSECRDCCDKSFAIEMANIGLFAAACHGVSGPYPWSHAGCGVTELVMGIAAGIQYNKCKDNCNVEYFDFSGQNPCP